MSAIDNFITVKAELTAEQVTLVAVSKTQSKEDILKRYALGHRVFGENRVQELAQKQKLLPKDIQWHQIGHLQTNKVKFIVDFVALIHSGDSLKMLSKINQEAKKINRTIKVLLQVKVAQEEAKHGLLPAQLKDVTFLNSIKEFDNIKICGLMAMASFVADNEQVKKEFEQVKSIFDSILKAGLFVDFEYLSMGMSGDYKLAITAGANMVRIGSLIF